MSITKTLGADGYTVAMDPAGGVIPRAVTGPNGEVSLQAGGSTFYIGDAAADTITIDRAATGGNVVASTSPVVETVNGKTWTRTASYNAWGELLSISAATVA